MELTDKQLENLGLEWSFRIGKGEGTVGAIAAMRSILSQPNHSGDGGGKAASAAFPVAQPGHCINCGLSVSPSCACARSRVGITSRPVPQDGGDERECLSDVVSHFDNLRAGLCAQRLAASDANDADSIAYWNHEISVLERMKAQAQAALASKAAAVPQDGGDEQASFEAWWDSLPSSASRQDADSEYEADVKEWALMAWQAALASNKAAAVAVDFPYQRTFDAIAAATKIEAGHVAISVRAFSEAYNATHPATAQPSKE